MKILQEYTPITIHLEKEEEAIALWHFLMTYLTDYRDKEELRIIIRLLHDLEARNFCRDK